jgi:hypothetical protein
VEFSANFCRPGEDILPVPILVGFEYFAASSCVISRSVQKVVCARWSFGAQRSISPAAFRSSSLSASQSACSSACTSASSFPNLVLYDEPVICHPSQPHYRLFSCEVQGENPVHKNRHLLVSVVVFFSPMCKKNQLEFNPRKPSSSSPVRVMRLSV